jgi:seryl-tRNA synthetase
MVLEIQLFREDFGGDPDFIKESQRRRYRSTDDVDAVIEADSEWRKGKRCCSEVTFPAKYELDQSNATLNRLNKQMSDKHKVLLAAYYISYIL